jgi:hypothetical protein
MATCIQLAWMTHKIYSLINNFTLFHKIEEDNYNLKCIVFVLQVIYKLYV